jgi:UDP-N-acetylmuramate dehydrogenase
VLSARDCAFSYRDSALKREPHRYVVLSVTFMLRKRGAPTLNYKELVDALAAKKGTPRLKEVRAMVLELRKQKSMVLDPNAPDENLRSAGSFFLNPIVPTEQADELVKRLAAEARNANGETLPRYPAAKPEHTKLPAAWLIEAAGFAKGERRGAVGISTKHSLALVCQEGATTADLLALAAEIEERVQSRFGIRLEREPVLLG